MAIDTSTMQVIQTPDRFHRFVCHDRKLLTTGFGSLAKLQEWSNAIASHPIAMRIMGERFRKEFGGDPAECEVVVPVPAQKHTCGAIQFMRADGTSSRTDYFPTFEMAVESAKRWSQSAVVRVIKMVEAD